MRRTGLGAALAMAAVASYAWAAPQEGRLGAEMPSATGQVSGQPPAAARTRIGGAPARFGQALSGLRPEGGPATRGAAEIKVYQNASPAVVMVITKTGFGSGGLISADGRIITNLHVVGDQDEVGVVFKPKTEGGKIVEADVRPAKVLRRDGVTDLALIQVSEVPPGITPLKLGSTADVQVGEDVHAIGHPTGQTWTYTRGIVSQIRRDYPWTYQDKSTHKATVIQTQTPINPGNSGGPLLDDDLNIVGINSFGGEGEGMNYAVSADDVKAFLAGAGDRVAAKGGACEATAVAQQRNKKNDTDVFGMDGDCDGKADYLAMSPDDKRAPITLIFDDDKDGKIDSMMIDENRDGTIDEALYDTDGDGEPDMRGLFKKGGTEPYRYLHIKK